jgi:hypothetical protein
MEIGSYAGLAAFFGLAVLILVSFTQGRDIRRLREWAGSSPERDAERKETTSAVAARRAEELRRLDETREAEREAADLRETRRQRREQGLPELTRGERLRQSFSGSRDRLADPRYLVGLFLVLVLIGGGVAYAALHGSSSSSSGGGGDSAKKVSRSEIEVSVLNGTAVPGLAADYGEKVKRKGFELGEVGNTHSAEEDSFVAFRNGHAPEAHRVAKALSISSVEPENSEISSLSGGAPVTLVVGEDNASTAG